MDCYLLRLACLAPSAQKEPPEPTDPLASTEGTYPGGSPIPLAEPTSAATVKVLDMKLHDLLHDLTHDITKEMGKISQELSCEVTHLGECTDTLETKFDELVQYDHVLEEDNAALKHTVSQFQMQQEDLENRQLCQNLQIRGVPETISEKEIVPYLLRLFVNLAPHITDMVWCLDKAHRCLASKPPAGTNSRDNIVYSTTMKAKKPSLWPHPTKPMWISKETRFRCSVTCHPSPWLNGRVYALLPLIFKTAVLSIAEDSPFRLSASRDGVQY